jgi:hypothetical protein
MSRRSHPWIAHLASLAFLAGLAHADPCPQSRVVLPGTSSGPTTAAVYDTSGYGGSGGWDMTAGRVHMYSTGTLAGVTTYAFDDYDVTGVPPGTVVNLLATLTVDGAVWTDGCGGSGCGGYYRVTFRHGADSLEVLHADHLFTGRLDHHDEIQLLVPITAGQPEQLEIRTHGQRSPGGAHYSEATSVLSFTGLPEGVGITSCKGFAGSVVPVRTNTWGRIKTMYR